MTPPVNVHIIGAGLAGLSAAVELASTGATIHLYEAAKAAGGRCRSYYDPHLNMETDNGNHLMLSGNHHALSYLEKIGGLEQLALSPDARLQFTDLRNGDRWAIAPPTGKFPFGILSKTSRPPEARLRDYLEILKLMLSQSDTPIEQKMRCDGPLYHKFLRPVLLAALNTDPASASSALARQVLRDTLMKGTQACKPIIARRGLSKALIDPALSYLKKHGANQYLSTRVLGLSLFDTHASSLNFEGHSKTLAPTDIVILATPPQFAKTLLPGVKRPDEFNAIVNIHFAIAAPHDLAPITGVIGATTEWLFAYEDRLSVTISAANRLLERTNQQIAEDTWREASMIADLNMPMPRWRVVREKRATFAATPSQNALRPGAKTPFSNVFLAGDWTATGLPATIEGAIKSGKTAAGLAQALFANAQPASIDTPASKIRDIAYASYR